MASMDSPGVHNKDSELPSWLANHLSIEWNSEDIDALLDSIDASQTPRSPGLPQLPAEILLLILEHVPVAYVLDWRLVCRGFRDAINGPILYHQLQRLDLIGYLGAKSSLHMRAIYHEEYEELYLMPTRLQSMDYAPALPGAQQNHRPSWTDKFAVFKMRDCWFDKHKSLGVMASKSKLLSQLFFTRNDLVYGTLTWIIKLDKAAFDLDLPLEPDRRHFAVDVDMKSCTLRVEWRPMLFRFLKAERALRLLMDKKRGSKFTFSLSEDCLRAIRRQGLHKALNMERQIDRHIKWSLRLLRPLWGAGTHRDPSLVEPAEADAVRVLLLLRREASLSDCQIKYLWQLSTDYEIMVKDMDKLSKSLRDIKGQLLLPGHSNLYEVDVGRRDKLPINPIGWTDDLRVDVEMRVQRWKSLRGLMEQMQTLLVTSKEIMAIPQDAFDVLTPKSE